MKNVLQVIGVLVVACVVSVEAKADTITDGFTFSVASDFLGGDGSHFHSSTGGDFGNPSGKAEVGSFFDEEVRGLSEYDLSSLGAATSAFVTFDVFSLGGLFDGDNDFLYVGGITVDAYQGNNQEDLEDFQASSLGVVGQFSTGLLSVGDTLSFDITDIFNASIAGASPSLGIRLAINGSPNGGAITFDTFRLTTDNQSTVGRVRELVEIPERRSPSIVISA